MSYKALYRTYRPSTFQEVAGQQHIVQTLMNGLASNKIAHAYLFTGPRGTGKTSMAKLLAKAVNCEEGFGHQCNVCKNCLAINDGSHPDVIEIDAASNNGVDEVRDLIDKIKYAPITGKYKVYIIDEVHMMTSGAFNALLKTLEEPPSYVLFILATTEPYKVIPTIVSRCQRYDFSKVNDHDIRGKLIEIMKQEHIDYEKRAVDTIISLSDGGVRDALSMLDQVRAYAGSMIKEDDVLALFGLAGVNEKINLLKYVASSDVALILTTLNDFVLHGVDIRRLLADLLEILKDLLIYTKTLKSDLMSVLTYQEAEDLLTYLDHENIADYIDILLKGQADFKNISNIKAMFEVMILKLAYFNKKVVIDEESKPQPVIKPQPVKKEVVVEELLIDDLEDNDDEDDTRLTEEDEFVQEEISFEPIDEQKAPINNNIPKLNEPTKPIQQPSFIDEALEKEKAEVEPVKVEETSLSISGDKIFIDDDNIIKIMVLGDKDERIALTNVWHQIKKFMSDQKLAKFASLLSDGRPYILCKQVLILEYDLISIAEKVNFFDNQHYLQQVLATLLNRQVLVYGLSRSECLRLKKVFMDLNQIKKLPDRKSAVVEVEGYKL